MTKTAHWLSSMYIYTQTHVGARDYHKVTQSRWKIRLSTKAHRRPHTMHNHYRLRWHVLSAEVKTAEKSPPRKKRCRCKIVQYCDKDTGSDVCSAFPSINCCKQDDHWPRMIYVTRNSLLNTSLAPDKVSSKQFSLTRFFPDIWSTC